MARTTVTNAVLQEKIEQTQRLVEKLIERTEALDEAIRGNGKPGLRQQVGAALNEVETLAGRVAGLEALKKEQEELLRKNRNGRIEMVVGLIIAFAVQAVLKSVFPGVP